MDLCESSNRCEGQSVSGATPKEDPAAVTRTIQGIITKHSLMKQPLVVINKSGGAGAAHLT